MQLGPYVICYTIAIGVVLVCAYFASIADDIKVSQYEGMPMPQPKYPWQIIYTILGIFVLVAGFMHVLYAIDKAFQNNLPIMW